MTKVSRKSIDSLYLSKFLNDFWSLIAILEDKDQVKLFLKDLLTHTEIKMFAKRIQIAKMLMDGYSYQDIKSYVKVTDATISKISNILAKESNGLDIGIKYLQKQQKKIKK